MIDVDALIESKFRNGRKLVPARLQAAMALLERLREHPSLRLGDHLSRAGQSFISQEAYGKQVHSRFQLQVINKTHGRRSSSIGEWAQDLLDLLSRHGFASLGSEEQHQLLSQAQDRLAGRLRELLNRDPLSVRSRGRSATAAIRELLAQADQKGAIAEVAQYLVGAKLLLRFPDRAHEIPAHRSNKGDRRWHQDEGARRGDFDLGDFVFEVAMGLPDEKHLEQIAGVLEDPGPQFWLLVRDDRQVVWRDEVAAAELDARRVVVTPVDLFIGQNIAELGGLSSAGGEGKLAELIRLYNEKWNEPLGSPGLKIILK